MSERERERALLWYLCSQGTVLIKKGKRMSPRCNRLRHDSSDNTTKTVTRDVRGAVKPLVAVGVAEVRAQPQGPVVRDDAHFFPVSSALDLLGLKKSAHLPCW